MRGIFRSVGLLALLTIAAAPSDWAYAAMYLPGSQAARDGPVVLAQSRRGPRANFQPPPLRSLQRVPAGAADRLRSSAPPGRSGASLRSSALVAIRTARNDGALRMIDHSLWSWRT
jgi:hypothetical protein